MPPYVSSAGEEAIELAAMAGLVADEWQKLVTIDTLGEREDGRWAAFEVGLEVPRQNGKGGIYEIRELAGLFLLGERLLIHSAHEYKTAEQALDRMEALIDGCADLSRRVRTIKRSHGQEGIYLTSGQVLRYFTRTASGGRGFSCDFLGLDEAMKIKHSMHAAMFPTMAARPNAQILYAGSAVDQETMEDGRVFARIRERGIRGGDPRMAYFGWSAPFDHPSEVSEEQARDPEMWAMANPAMGIRVGPEYIEIEQRALSHRGFVVERLGVGDWPCTDGRGSRVISEAAWIACGDPDSEIDGDVSFAIDATPEHTHGAIAAAGERSDGLGHFEIVDHRKGTEWVVPRCVELQGRNPDAEFAVDGHGPVAALIADLVAAGVSIHEVSTREYGRACGAFAIAVAAATAEAMDDGDDPLPRGIRYRTPQPELSAALVGATKRSLGDAWAWSRRNSTVDISPLVASTLALWLAEATGGAGVPLIAFV